MLAIVSSETDARDEVRRHAWNTGRQHAKLAWIAKTDPVTLADHARGRSARVDTGISCLLQGSRSRACPDSGRDGSCPRGRVPPC